KVEMPCLRWGRLKAGVRGLGPWSRGTLRTQAVEGIGQAGMHRSESLEMELAQGLSGQAKQFHIID
ncbi:MAG: hypothetical protein K2Q10_09255, partial [Rhodospirillales bacterium]|nr:hypothetical protein [Rhodospirillales bacterium]